MNVHFNPNVVISVEPLLSSFPLIRLQSHGLSLISLCLEAALGDQVPACMKEKLQLLLFLVTLSCCWWRGVAAACCLLSLGKQGRAGRDSAP